VTDHRIITDNQTLYEQYDKLDSGDLVVGRIRLKNAEESLLLDLVERGVKILPSALSQLSCRSKCLQARLFKSEMIPHTTLIYDLHDIQEAITSYQRHKIGKVVTKQDRQNAGMGIHLWNSTEEVFSQASFGNMQFPFVLQPFLADCRDIRVIILGDYVEAYWRHNPDNFRNNLHFGGESRPCELTESQWQLCQRVMKRGRYPYAHLDLMVTREETTWLAEINLRGGIRGAQIDPATYKAKVEEIHQDAIKAFQNKL